MKIDKDSKAGIYITVIFHLTVIICLLVAGIVKQSPREESFVLDFSKYEELERLQKEIEFKEDISRKLQEKIDNAAPIPSRELRNYAVDGSTLKDDRMSKEDADKLYKEAARLAKELKSGQESAIEEDAINETVDMSRTQKDETKKKEYSGPSVLRYNLEGRKASHLKIPAYRCYNAGEVTVIITVDRKGNVINAKVDENQSSNDQCLRSFAIRAARLSKFSMSTTAPSKQMGEITYQFIAQ